MPYRSRVSGRKDAISSAQEAGLNYTSDRRPGIRRLRHGKAFRYVGADGKPVTSQAQLARIRSLVIPPAWTDVWICPASRGHLQATGRDARGRKQYRYHPKWRDVRDGTKYGRMLAFGRALPAVRRRTDADLGRAGLPKTKVLAAVVKLLEKTFIRVGNDEYARANHSFGLTTMKDGHVKIDGSKVRFIFRGKSGVEHELTLENRRLAKIVKQCRDLPGQDLFQYRDHDGRVIDIGSADVNAYLKAITGQDFTSKDFRTWAGTVLAAGLLRESEAVDSEARAKKNIVRAIEEVAKQLGNTRAVCRKCYVHPAIINAYLDGSIMKTAARHAGRATRAIGTLTASEAAVLGLLQRRRTRDGH
ncbi:MAG TPA: DNA topoisomerase IB [Vicinamibacterales bacterium]|nr:DNA topoisomerase IB [Vicinamibacterales bacterium]